MPKENIYSNGNEKQRVEVSWFKTFGEGKAEIAINDGTKGQGTLFVDLDRTGINRLIWALRRARDQAFGKDE